MLRPKPVLLILGAGGHGRSVAESAELSGEWADIIFADDSWPSKEKVSKFKIVSNISKIKFLDKSGVLAITAVGNNQLRNQWNKQLMELGIPLATIIHPNTIISPTAVIGHGVAIMAGCVVGTHSQIGNGVILNMGTLLDHDVFVDEYAHLSVGVKVAGGKEISQYSFLEVGTIIPH